MTLFGSTGGRVFRTDKGIDLDLTTVLILTTMSLVLLQAFGLIFRTTPLGNAIKLGPIFILISVAMTASISIAIFKKLIQDKEVTRKDIFAIVVVSLLTIVLLFFLRDALPEIFEQSMIQLQSVIGV